MLEKSHDPDGLGRLRPVLRLLVWAVVLSGFAVSALAQSLGSAGLGLATRAQIEGLQEEKATRSPAFRKLDSQLIYALRQQRHGRAVAAASALMAAVQPETDGRFTVDIDAEVRPALLLFINQRGGEVLGQYPRQRSLRVLGPLELMETLAARPEVRFIRPAVAAHTHAGEVVSEGDVAHQANTFRAGFLATGNGVKIGVLSDSANYHEDSRSRGELPEITILPGAFGFGAGEGTAMMEIIHDLAPDSELYFATAFGGVASFADNIRRLYDAGCRIIVDDVIYFNESPFQDGPIAQAVNEVSAGGALYFSSAGNEGNLTHSTSGTWEGDFNDAGPVSFGRGGRVHNFGGADYNTLLTGGGFRRLDLFWADPLGQSTNDYDLYVLDADGNVVRSSTNIQDGQQDPYEWIGTSTVGERVVIVKYSGDSRFLHLGAFRERLAIGTSGSTRGHNASGAANAFCVAATRAPSPPTAFVGGTTNPVESFSSNGPRRMFFHPDGQPITPGDFSSTGGMLLQKPDLTAADGVATSVPGFGLFLGTSAAAPHAAAIAALLWSYNPALTPEQIRAALTTGVLDIEAPGWDRDSGAGIPMLPLMINLIPAPAPRLVLEEIQFTDADGSGALNAGECAEIRVVLRNLASTNAGAATGVTAVLTSATAGLLVEPVPQDFPEVTPGGVATHALPFRISSDSTYICWRGGELQLHVTSDNAGDYLFSIPIEATTNGVGPPVEYQATDVPLPIPDAGTLEAPLSVQDFTAGIAEASVSLHLQHTYDSDLHISLVAPDGTEVVLSANRGGSGMNFGSSCATQTVFSDHATNAIASGTAPFVGTFRPETPLSALWGRTGPDVNGVWTLKVTDGVEADTGTLLCWSLYLSPTVCYEVGNPCLVPPELVVAPGPQVATNGDTVLFEAIATGTEPLHYIWLFNETNTLPATGAALSLTNLVPEQAGTYTVVVSNSYGTATSSAAELAVLVRPFIATQPSDLVATNGDTVVLTVGAGGTEPLTYQWFFDGTNALSEGTSPTLVLTNVNLASIGTYTVRVDNDIGSTSSVPAFLTVLVGPGIAVEPADLVVTNGAMARLEVVASGSEPLTYQWWHEETNEVAGATGPELELAVITPEQAGGYAVEVSNAVGSVRSRAAQVTVLSAPVLVSAPVDLVTTNGAAVELTVSATGSEPLAYQWYYTAGLEEGETGSVIAETNVLAGATNATLALAAVTPEQAGWYAVAVSNFIGSTSSAPALLTVLVGPGIAVEPADLVVTNGAVARLEVVASGSEPLTYQWWHEETNEVAGATGPELELAVITPEQAGGYAVEVSNAVGSVRSRAAQVTVLSAPVLVSAPVDLVTTNGAAVALTVSATGSEPLAYQWYYTAGLEEGETGSVIAETNVLAGATNATLALAAVTPEQAGWYAVAVSNFIGSTSSVPAFLTVLVGPGIAVEPADLVVTNGAMARLEVVASGSEPLTYQWWHEETNEVAGATGPELELAAITPEQAGWYAVEVSNAVGSVRSRAAQVTVLSAPVLVSAPVDLVTTNGAAVELTVSATGSEPLAYQWYYTAGLEEGETGSVIAETNALAGATNATLALAAVTPEQAGWYAVAVSNFIGSTSSVPAFLTVLVGPGIAVEPADLVVTNGAVARLEVVASGSEPLTYQWWHEETNEVAGATGPELELAAITPEQAGWYAVEVSNAVGSVRSRAAQVTVLSAPVLVNAPVDLVTTNGAAVELAVSATGSEPLAYQWYYTADLELGATGSVIAETNVLAGATNATLALAAVTPEQAGWYAVAVSNFIGSTSSVPAFLTVLVGPGIAVEPADLVVTNGAVARLEVVASGSEPLTYQWWHEETNEVAGATGPELELAAITPEQAGWYAVEVSNAVGSVRSRAAQVTVLSAPVLVSAPVDLVTTNGAAVELTVSATGSEPLAYQWYYTAGLEEGETGSVIAETNALAGATNATLALAAVTPEQAGWYAVAVSNFIGSTSSVPAFLTVLVGPGIAVEPADLVVTNGAMARLEVVASGSEPLTYQWWHEETNEVAGATGPELELAAITPEQAGWYAVEVSNAVGSVRSRAAQVTVLSAPVLVSAPVDLVTTNGAAVELTVSATGSEPLAYQWYYTAGLEEGETGSVIAETNALAGATNATLALAAVTPEQAGWYAVAVSNFIGSTSSVPAFLTVLVGPGIAVEPADLVVTNGAVARLEVVASGSEPLTYQWWHEETNEVAGATGPELELAAITPEQAGWYAVEVSNAVGSVRSRAAQVTVLSAPVLVSAPVDLVTTNGAAVELTVSATGSEPLAYQWYYTAGLEEGETGSVIAETNALAGATNATLALAAVTPEQAGWYAVAVSNFIGSTSSVPAFLTVLVGPGIAVEPADLVVTNGAVARLEVVASGSEPLTYQWWHEETNEVAGATGPELELAAITPEQAGWYAVEVSNAVGSVRSRAAQVTVLSAPVLVSAPVDLVTTNGAAVELTVSATGSEPLAYQWYYTAGLEEGETGSVIAETNALAGATNATLALAAVTPEQAGWYAVAVSNFIGSTSSVPAFLTVLVGPGIAVEPADLVVTNGAVARLEVVASGSEPLTYQWWHEETNEVAGATGPELELAAITPEQAGWYAVEVSNAVGSVRSRAAQVTVLSAPVLVSAPVDLVTTNGAAVELTVSATGSEPLAYQWYYTAGLEEGETGSVIAETNALAGATNATLALAAVTPEQAGWYAVAVSNFIGSTSSVPAFLTVLVGPGIAVEPADLVVTNGAVARLEVVASGSEPLTYQWWHEETNEVAGATGPELELAAITPEQAGWYAVEVSNAVGSVRSRAAQVTVLSAPVLVSAPVDLVTTNGAAVELTVSATGSEPLAYQWYYTAGLEEGETGSVIAETNALAGATNATLALAAVTPEQAGWYAVAVSNFIGSTSSVPAFLTVLVGPGIAVEPADLVVTNGAVARLEVVASGSEPLTYQWWHEETNEVAGATGPELELAAITPEQAGAYAVEVSNAVGSVRSRAAQVTVLFPPQIHTQPQDLAAPRGANAEFAVSATALPSPSYQWFFAVTNLLQNETNAVLVRTNAQAVDVGPYHVEVSNILGVVTSSVAMLWVDDPPSIVAQPQNLTVRIGQTAAFHVLGSSSQPLEYYWYFEGTNLVSSNGEATLLLTNVTLAQGGAYHAVATNAFGASASQTAILRVLVPTVFGHPTWDDNVFELSFPTLAGLRYTIEYSTNLVEANWLRVVGASKLLGTGELMTIQDSAATNASRFYRVLVE